MDASQRFCRYVRAGAAILATAMVSAAVTPAYPAEPYTEDAVKAAYLYRFAGYVNWPEGHAADAPFVIDVLRSPGVARELRRLLPGHSINGRAAQVREISGIHELGGAEILFVGAGHAEVLRSLAPSSNLPPVLLVTDEQGGLNAGSALNFLTIDRNVRFEVSLTTADRWGLRISSELLGVAVRVQGGRRQSSIPRILSGSRPGRAT
jgi:YfiR/HmsC-like